MSYAPRGFVLCLTAAVFMLIDAIVLAGIAYYATDIIAMYPWLEPYSWADVWIALLAGFEAMCSVILFVCAWLIHTGRVVAGGVLAVIFSILSLAGGGGFIAGFVMGVVGGAFALAG